MRPDYSNLIFRKIGRRWSGKQQITITKVSEQDVIEIKEYLEKRHPLLKVVEDTGFWDCPDYMDIGDTCSECGWDSAQDGCYYKFCPMCGTQMTNAKE